MDSVGKKVLSREVQNIHVLLAEPQTVIAVRQNWEFCKQETSVLLAVCETKNNTNVFTTGNVEFFF